MALLVSIYAWKILALLFIFSSRTILAAETERRLIVDNDKNIIFEGYLDEVAELGIILTKQGVQDFRKKHDLKKDVTLFIQKMSPRKSLRIDEQEYFLDNLIPMDLLDPEMHYMFEDEEKQLPPVNIFTKDERYESIMLSKDRDENIRSITIFNKKDGSSIDFKPIASTYFAKVRTDDANVEGIAKKYHLSEGRKGKSNPFLKISNLRAKMEEDESFCVFRKVIQIALAYDSSFCEEAGGETEAWDEMFRIIGGVTQKYGQIGVCASFKVTWVEGFCKEARDPYRPMIRRNKSGCNGFGLLDEFQSMWQIRRLYVFRDTAHLFSGTGLECNPTNGCVVGCAYIASICGSEGYGVSHATFSKNSNMRTVLVAHEIGHNYGANHNPSNTDFIMYPSVNDAPLGFSAKSISSFKTNTYLCTHTCLEIGGESIRLRKVIFEKVMKLWKKRPTPVNDIVGSLKGD